MRCASEVMTVAMPLLAAVVGWKEALGVGVVVVVLVASGFWMVVVVEVESAEDGEEGEGEDFDEIVDEVSLEDEDDADDAVVDLRTPFPPSVWSRVTKPHLSSTSSGSESTRLQASPRFTWHCQWPHPFAMVVILSQP